MMSRDLRGAVAVYEALGQAAVLDDQLAAELAPLLPQESDDLQVAEWTDPVIGTNFTLLLRRDGRFYRQPVKEDNGAEAHPLSFGGPVFDQHDVLACAADSLRSIGASAAANLLEELRAVLRPLPPNLA